MSATAVQYILLPGLHGSDALFAPFVAEAPREARIRAVAYPPDEPYDYDAAERCVRQALPTEGRYILVAESFSGPVALRIAAEAPSGLVGLVLAGSFARSPLPLSLKLVPDAALRLLPVRSALPRWLLGGGGRGVAWDDHLRAVLATVSAHAFVGRVRTIDGVDVRPLLPRIAVPLLYLQATRNRLVWPRFGRALVAGVPHGTLHRIDGAHMLLQTAPRACWAATAGFAARLDNRAGGAATRLA